MTKKAAQRAPRKKKEEGGTSKTPVELFPAPVNWAKSTVTEAILKKFSKKDEIFWRAAGDKFAPNLGRER